MGRRRIDPDGPPDVFRFVLNASGDPEPCPDYDKWRGWFETADRVIARTTVKGMRLSTFFLAMEAWPHYSAGPLLWESGVYFDGGDYFLVDRYLSKDDALRSHENIADALAKLAQAGYSRSEIKRALIE